MPNYIWKTKMEFQFCSFLNKNNKMVQSQSDQHQNSSDQEQIGIDKPNGGKEINGEKISKGWLARLMVK